MLGVTRRDLLAATAILGPALPCARSLASSGRDVQLRVAGAQIPVARDIDRNVAALERAIDRAAKERADVLLTPEGSLSGYCADFDQAAVARAIDRITRRARQARLALALGTCFQEADGQRYDELRFYDKDGALVGFHTKILLTRKIGEPRRRAESDLFRSKPLETFRFLGLTVGGLVCNDMWANPAWTPQPDPHLSHRLAEMGARLVFHAVNSGQSDGDDGELARHYHRANLRLRARSGRQWFVVADAADPAGKRASHAPSGIVDPTGRFVAAVPPVGEQVFVHAIDVRAG